MAKSGKKVPTGNPIRPQGMPSKSKQASPPRTKSGPVSKPGGAVPNTHR